LAEKKDGTVGGSDAAGMLAIATEASTPGVLRLLLRSMHESKDSAVGGRGDC